MIVECADKTSCCTDKDKSEQHIHDVYEPHEDFTPFYRKSYLLLYHQFEKVATGDTRMSKLSVEGLGGNGSGCVKGPEVSITP